MNDSSAWTATSLTTTVTLQTTALLYCLRNPSVFGKVYSHLSWIRFSFGTHNTPNSNGYDLFTEGPSFRKAPFIDDKKLTFPG